MEYIPTYIRRKHGLEQVEYDIPELEEYLKDTYGITVYQEQVMLLSQSLAGFSKGKADSLRKAMGKKKLSDLQILKSDFLDGIREKGLEESKCEKIWTDWEAFASYAFNKSHSTCYAFVAYQTGYLKAHYPAEYMAAVLSNNSHNIDKISLMMQECRRLGIPVLGPCVNESKQQFSVNDKGEIRFGLCAVKGVGEGPAENIIEERSENGIFKSIFDFCARCNLRIVNKKTLESLVKGGAFDFDTQYHKQQYLELDANQNSGLDLAVKYGIRSQEVQNSNQASLFGENQGESLSEPALPPCEEMSILEECQLEKELLGIFISKHPMDTFKVEFQALTNTKLTELENLDELAKIKPSPIVAGIVVKMDHLVSKRGSGYAKFILQDYSGQFTFFAFGNSYDALRNILYPNNFILLKCKIERPRFPKEGGREFEINIAGGEKMDEAKEKYIKGLEMKLNTLAIQQAKVTELQAILDKHSGDSAVHIHVVHPEKKYQLDFVSEKKVQLSAELIDDLELSELDYSFITRF